MAFLGAGIGLGALTIAVILSSFVSPVVEKLGCLWEHVLCSLR